MRRGLYGSCLYNGSNHLSIWLSPSYNDWKQRLCGVSRRNHSLLSLSGDTGDWNGNLLYTKQLIYYWAILPNYSYEYNRKEMVCHSRSWPLTPYGFILDWLSQPTSSNDGDVRTAIMTALRMMKKASNILKAWWWRNIPMHVFETNSSTSHSSC